jgi:hypothetical protein
MNKQKRISLFEYIKNNETSDKQDLLNIARGGIQIPTYRELSRRYVASKIAHAIACIRDDKENRIVLADRTHGKTKYVNLGLCQNVEVLKKIKERTEKDIFGRKMSLKNIKSQLDALSKLSHIETPKFSQNVSTETPMKIAG